MCLNVITAFELWHTEYTPITRQNIGELSIFFTVLPFAGEAGNVHITGQNTGHHYTILQFSEGAVLCSICRI